jgi:hypothetical protein
VAAPSTVSSAAEPSQAIPSDYEGSLGIGSLKGDIQDE